jgi:hypothetical protein
MQGVKKRIQPIRDRSPESSTSASALDLHQPVSKKQLALSRRIAGIQSCLRTQPRHRQSRDLLDFADMTKIPAFQALRRAFAMKLQAEHAFAISEGLLGIEFTRGQKLGTGWQLKGFAVPVQHTQRRREMPERAALAGRAELYGRPADFFFRARVDFCPQCACDQLRTQTDAQSWFVQR